MEPITLADGAVLSVRPIEPDDVDRLGRMFERLSPTTIYRRFFSPIHEASPRMLMWLTNVDHDRREALVALDGDEIVAVARYDGQSRRHRGGDRGDRGGRLAAPGRRQAPGPPPGRGRPRPRLRALHRHDAPRQPRGDRPPPPALERTHRCASSTATTRRSRHSRGRAEPFSAVFVAGWLAARSVVGGGRRSAIRTTCRRPRTPCCRRDRARGRHRARRSR